jgi:transposase
MGIAGRPKAELILSETERAELVRLTKRAQVNRALAFRARIILSCVEASNSVVSAKLRTSNQTVGKWRKRFVCERLDGLYDEPRVGAPRSISDDDVEALIVKTLESSPKGRTHWSTRTMAAHIGMSHSSVGRVWRAFGLKLTYCALV